jgi:predicted DNA binding CopG/RHH family protein
MAAKKKHWSECTTEAEEARWWDDNPEYATEIIKKAIQDGTATIGRKKISVVDAAPTRSVSLRLASSDIETARMIAAKKGMPYQTYIKAILHQALERERKAGKAPARGVSMPTKRTGEGS